MSIVEINPGPPYATDPSNCDREPIQHIGAVQPIGFLIALSNDWQVERLSANSGKFLGATTDALLGASLRDVFRPDAVHSIRNRSFLLTGADAVERVFGLQLQDDGPLYDLAIHRSGALVIVEAEPNIASGELNAGAMVRSMLARLRAGTDLAQESARLVSALTGFDRVMIYRFHVDGSGEVIAERTRDGIDSFLGLHYPADDIPQQARALLVRNPVRMLVDVSGVSSMLLPEVAQPMLDLSMSTLRAHSPMHVEYLQNMGVGATLTASLIRDGKLWGLISCHHMTPRHVGFEQRTTIELFAQMLSFLMEQRERDDTAAYEARALLLRRQLVAAVVERGSAAESVGELAARMVELVPCDGVAIYVDGVPTLDGDTPTGAECMALVPFLARNAPGTIFATDALSRDHAPAQDFVDHIAGMLVLPITRAPGNYLVFFRNEVLRSVKWAGEPGKQLVHGPHGARLTPRKSFEAWRELVRGRSAAWTSAELSAAEAMRVTWLEMALHGSELTDTDSRRASQKQDLLIAELNHRVRNILGLIHGLVSQSRTSACDVETFAGVLGDRVGALSRAHDQITARNWGPGSLETLIETEVAATLGEAKVQVTIGGAMVKLQHQSFATVVLVVHELMTNAAKHGALSSAVGKLAIGWHVEDNGDVILDWRESGGPAVAWPIRRGFGSRIIEDTIPHELGGKAILDHAQGGLHAWLLIPAIHAVIEDEPPTPIVALQGATAEGRLSGTVLLVEDNLLVALDAEDMLLSLGAATVLIASNVAEALRLIIAETPSFALLDINLGDEMSWPIATRLRELGIRYVFATGYGDGIEYPLAHRHAKSISKPYTQAAIAGVIGAIEPR